MTGRTVVVEVARLEAAHLADLVEQFATLLDSDGLDADPAVARLSPVAYPDDAGAADEFRRLTQPDLLERRRADSAVVLASLATDGAVPRVGDVDDAVAMDSIVVTLHPGESAAWLRTLAALRLVLASRLGVTEDAAHDDGDPRFGVYEWLGYRLEGLLQALND